MEIFWNIPIGCEAEPTIGQLIAAKTQHILFIGTMYTTKSGKLIHTSL
jgi:hypothetical protein